MEEIREDIPMEELTPLCECKKCVVQREIDKVSEQECTCTYKDVVKEDEEGNEYATTEIDIKCDRCNEIDVLRDKLNKYDLLEKAYIDEDEWDKYDIVDGVIYGVLDIDAIRKSKLDNIREYKWVVSERPFFYDNYYQCNLQRDKSMMFDAMLALQNKILPEIEWKINDYEYRTVTDPLYFLNMKATSSMLVEKSFGIEDIIAQEINAITDISKLHAYDEIAKFDELFAK